MQYGVRVQGRFEQKSIPAEAALSNLDADPSDLTVAGGVYQIDLHVDGVVDEQTAQAAIAQLLTLEKQESDLKFLCIYADPNSNVITIQFIDKGPGQFSFTALLSAMPALLGLVFIIVVGFVLWQIYTNNPIWLWVLLAVGGGVVFYMLVKPSVPTGEIFGPRRSLATPSTQYEQQSVNMRTLIGNAKEDLKETKIEIAEKKKELKDLEASILAEQSKMNKMKDTTEKQRIQQEIKDMQAEVRDGVQQVNALESKEVALRNRKEKYEAEMFRAK